MPKRFVLPVIVSAVVLLHATSAAAQGQVFGYARLGDGAAFAEQARRAPAIGLGLRAELDTFAVDVSVANFALDFDPYDDMSGVAVGSWLIKIRAGRRLRWPEDRRASAGGPEGPPLRGRGRACEDSDVMDVTLFREALVGLLRELVDGPPGDVAFIVNPGDRGILGSLAQLPASDASARPGGRSSVAAHVHHLRYGFELLNRWARGEDPFADANWAASWRMLEVTDGEWRDLIAGLEREARAWMSAVSERQDWDSTMVSGAMSSVAHLAYHMGAIRQLVPAASGPPARD